MISVILPTFNRADMLPDAIQSFVSQQADAELIIVDNGSSDGTGKLLDLLKSDNVSIIHLDKNVCPAKAINVGMRAARGDIIGQIHSDDILEPGILAKRILWHEDGSEVVYTDWEQIYQDKRSAGIYKPGILGEIVSRDHINFVTMSWKKSVIEKIGYLDEDFEANCDWLFKIRCMKECSMKYIPEVSVKYRVWHGQQSVTARNDGTNEKEYQLMRKKLDELYGGLL